ncbi:AMP-binding protein [Chromatiales bacterium (ex Bugula neritina AB1)]|nr:AMP-binding protein [Chromatiales bacterium (ex Bugula neritina AB1)]
MGNNPFASFAVGDNDDDSARPQGGLSYVAGSKQPPLNFITVSQLLDRACDQNGAGDAIVFADTDVTYSWYSLREKADELAAGLLALGIRRGNRVAIWSPNREEWVIAQFGTARIGAILVNINPAYQSAELEFALNKVRARVLIMARSQNNAQQRSGQNSKSASRKTSQRHGRESSDYIAIIRNLAPEIDRSTTQNGANGEFYAQRLPALKHVVVLGEGKNPAASILWSELLSLAGPAHRARVSGLSSKLDPDDPINIQFTSGTTGAPKGATLSHFNIVNNARFCAGAMQLTAEDRVGVPVPLYHCFGMVLGVLACASVGAAVVFVGETFTAAATLEAVSRYRCTALHGVPTMFISMLENEEFDHHDLSLLRTGIIGGAPCPMETMQRIMNEMNMEHVTVAYGMTETSPVSFQSSVDDSPEQRVSTVGRVHPHVEVKIVDSQGGIVAPGQQGELCTRGYSVMRGYWDDASQTREAIDAAGWMHTGDLATIDTDGYCRIVGRIGDMLIRGGENIYPREIEECLMQHPAIVEAQVFGVPHTKLGEQVCAWLITRNNVPIELDTIATFCDGQIARFKIPELIRVVNAFPMTVTGKPQKHEMQKAMMHELNRSSAS